MEKSTNQKEMQQLISPKNCTGIALCIAIVGLFIMCIGLFCPFCSYNPTILDATKRNVGVNDLSPVMILIMSLFTIGAVLWGSTIFMSFIKKFKADKNWKENTKRYIVVGVFICLFIFIAVIVAAAACVFYEIPESSFNHLETTPEIGFWLFSLGGLLSAIAYLTFAILIHFSAIGKINIEKLALAKTKKPENHSQTSLTLAEKLKELQGLKESGVITEEEYQVKKEDLLKNYH